MPMTQSFVPAAEDAGDWRRWDQVWRDIGPGSDGILYTSSAPRSMLQFWQRAYFEDLWALTQGKVAGARYLELGAGRGTTSMYLASRGCDVTLLDLAPAGLRLAIENFRACDLRRPKVVIGDGRNTGLASNSYDCVYNIGLLEHFEDPVPVLRESLRVLKPGGLMYMVIVPEGSPWRSLPVRLALNPLSTGWRVLAAAARRVARVLGFGRGGASDTAGAADDMVRTTHSRGRYEQWLRDLGGRDVCCLPYNPYFQVYASPALERLITLPIYAAHLALKRRRCRQPLLVTSARRASCHLLLCRKAA
jgi:ubiquinone/menaquinone biosynthesis C-methylase UbiE